MTPLGSPKVERMEGSKVVANGGRKPPNAGKGRVKGVPNKITSDIKAMILAALAAKGGVKYLEKQADENPTAFLTLVGKVLPLTLAGDPKSPLVITRIELVAASDNGAD